MSLFFLMHGALWLSIKLQGNVRLRAEGMAQRMWYVVLLFAVVFLLFSAVGTNLFGNYMKSPALFVILLVTLCALFGTRIYMGKAVWWKAWWASGITIVGTTLFGVVGLYPSLLPSSLDPAYSLTIYNASSSFDLENNACRCPDFCPCGFTLPDLGVQGLQRKSHGGRPRLRR